MRNYAITNPAGPISAFGCFVYFSTFCYFCYMPLNFGISTHNW